MLHKSHKKNNIRIKFFINILACVIIGITVFFIAFASDLDYTFKDVTIRGHGQPVRMMPDSTAFHWHISEYNAIDKATYPMSLTGPLIEAVDKKMQGYGKYHMQMQYNLCNFIAYCHNKNTSYAGFIEALCNWGDPSKEFPNSINYESLTTKVSGQASYITPVATILNNIWRGMSEAYGPEFRSLQDEFIATKYLAPAIAKMRLNNAEYLEIFGRNGSYALSLSDIDNFDGEEFMTALLSSVYSDFYTADLSNIGSNQIDIGKANLIPFLYNVDKTGEDGTEIARYAYIAYIEGFLTAGRTDGFHYWEQEYELVFNKSYNDSDYDIEELRVKFDKARDVLSEEQGNKGNRLLGTRITEVIRSPYNVSTQLAQAKNIINDILGDIGVDSEYKDLIAKNYLMVKHMMDNSHIDSTIKDYCQGVVFNESKFSQGQFDEKNSNTALLSDFQLVECNKGWRDDTDKDGLSDKEELGTQVKHDITAFVKKKLNAGEDLWTKANDWKEFNDMIVVEGTSSADCKIYAKMYDYKSNPVLTDTDFDGINDGNGWGILGAPLNMRVDEDPKNNNFKGSSMTTREGDLNLEYNSDFRYLMWSENLYNDELSQMSLIMSNLAHNETITLKEKRKNYGTMNTRSYMERLGFTGIDTEELTYETDIKVRYYIGYKSIDYYSKKRGVIGIFLSTNESVEAYKKLAVDIDYLRDNNLYDQIARDIYSKISTDKIHALETEYGLDYCYWVSGKGIAGGIASEVATTIRKEDSDFKRNNNWYTIKDIYCYTFGAPKTHIGASYQHNFIKNIINEDDYLTKVIPDDKGYRNGFTYNASVYSDFIYNYKNLIRTTKYTGSYMQMNSVKNALNTLRKDHPSVMDDVNDDMSKLLSKHISNTSNEEDMKWTKNYVNTSDLATEIINQVSNRELESASSVKAYWTLAKVLEGLDEKTKNQRSYNKTIEQASREVWSYGQEGHAVILETIKNLGVWYVNHIPTYWNNVKRDIATEPAESYYDDYKDATMIEIDDESINIPDDKHATEEIGDKLTYYYPPFSEFETTYSGRNYYKRYVGDDCTGFSQGVTYTISNGDRGQAGDVNTATDGLHNHNISSSMLVNDNVVETAMLNLGWEKFYLSGSTWKRKRKINDIVQDKSLREIYGDNFNMSINFLEPGDLLCTSGHVEFYYGYIRVHKKGENKYIWIKTSDIDNSYAEYEEYLDDGGNDLLHNAAYSTFGWGNVKSEFPSKQMKFKYNIDSAFRWSGDTLKLYKTIWRKN